MSPRQGIAPQDVGCPVRRNSHVGVACQVECALPSGIGRLPAFLKQGVTAIVSHGLDRQESSPADHGEDKPAGQEMGEAPRQNTVQKRKKHHHHHERRRDHESPDDFAVAGKELEHLEQRQKVPLRARGVVRAGRVGRRVEVGAALGKHQHDHHAQNERACDRVHEELFGPEGGDRTVF